MRSVLTAIIGALLLFNTACEQLPARVDDSASVDSFLAQGRYRAACVGLKSQDDEIVTYTAQRLASYLHNKDARECLCNKLYDPIRHEVSLAAGIGVEGTKAEVLAECVRPAMDDAVLVDARRLNAVRVLGGIGAKNSTDILVGMMKTDSDDVLRALAAESLRYSKAATDALLDVVEADGVAEVRAAAAGALLGHKGDRLEEVLNEAARSDADGTVRAQALVVLAKGKRNSKVDALLCTAMLEDEDPEVREAAVKSYHGTKRKKAIDCVAKVLMEGDDSAAVRQTAMDTLKASPSEHVGKVLCAAVHPIVSKYVETTLPTPTNGTDIMKAQNDRDFEESYNCVQKAMGKGGYTCEGRYYLTNWYNNLGGNKALPPCPGLANQ